MSRPQARQEPSQRDYLPSPPHCCFKMGQQFKPFHCCWLEVVQRPEEGKRPRPRGSDTHQRARDWAMRELGWWQEGAQCRGRHRGGKDGDTAALEASRRPFIHANTVLKTSLMAISQVLQRQRLHGLGGLHAPRQRHRRAPTKAPPTLRRLQRGGVSVLWVKTPEVLRPEQ